MRRLTFTSMATAVLALAAVGPVEATQEQRNNSVTVIVNRIAATDNLDGDFIRKDGADFYTRVSLGGYWVKSPVWHGKDDCRPSWAANEYGFGKVVPITIRVMDEDGAFEKGDDHVDINPKVGEKDLNIWLNTETGQIWGDVQGRRGQQIYVRGAGSDSDKAEFWFTVT